MTNYSPPNANRIKKARRGLTLAEVAASTLLVGVLLVSSLKTTAFVTKHREVTSTSMRAAVLAEEMLAEVMSLRWEDPNETTYSLGLEYDEYDIQRSAYDDIDDYNGWVKSPPEDRFGQPYSALANWECRVNVSWAMPSTLASSAARTNLKRIQVTVTRADGTTLFVTGFAAKPPRESDPRVAGGTMLRSLSSQLDAGTNGQILMTAPIPNSIITSVAVPTSIEQPEDSESADSESEPTDYDSEYYESESYESESYESESYESESYESESYESESYESESYESESYESESYESESYESESYESESYESESYESETEGSEYYETESYESGYGST